VTQVSTHKKLLAISTGRKFPGRRPAARPFRPRRVYTAEEIAFLTAWDCWGPLADLALDQARALGNLEERDDTR
jgi:hypothetical protein